MKKTILVLATLFTLLTSCKKQTQPTPIQPSTPPVVATIEYKIKIINTTFCYITVNGIEQTQVQFMDPTLPQYEFTCHNGDTLVIDSHSHSPGPARDISVYSNNAILISGHQEYIGYNCKIQSPIDGDSSCKEYQYIFN